MCLDDLVKISYQQIRYIFSRILLLSIKNLWSTRNFERREKKTDQNANKWCWQTQPV